MVRINGMTQRISQLNRRELMAGLGAAVLAPATPPIVVAQGRASLTLRAKAGAVALRPGQPDTPIWSFQGSSPEVRLKRGEELEVTLLNELPLPVGLNWHGLDGVPNAEPLAARASLGPGGKDVFVVPLRCAGTMMCDLRLLGDGQARPSPARALIVGESEPVAVDRDEVLLIEDWRLRADGTAIAPGVDAKDAMAVYTANGLTTLDITGRTHERLRIRFINGFQRNVIAIKIEGHEIRVMALDGQPCEPFQARGGALVLAPGARADAFVDLVASPGSTSAILLHDGTAARPIARLVTSSEPPRRERPLPTAPALASNGLPARLDLKGSLRIELKLDGRQTDWVKPVNFANSTAPAFRARAGRTVVLALTNRGDVPAVFHLHGHHFRLLDRLDDGWKPFWLDTLAVDSGSTEHIAFAADSAGRWLMEMIPTHWAAPRLVRWYSVD